MAAAWFAEVGCSDCTGTDSMGCFDGGTERLGPYDTEAEADAMGTARSLSCGPWYYSLIEAEADAFEQPEEQPEQGLCANCGAEMDLQPMYPWCRDCAELDGEAGE